MRPAWIVKRVYKTSYRFKPGISNFGKKYSVTLSDGSRRDVIAGISTSSWQEEAFFSEQNWEFNVKEVLERQVSKAGNAGQESILSGDFYEAAMSYCLQVERSYTPEQFISSVSNSLGDSKYNAISEIIEECSEELLEALDYSIGGDGVGQNRFGLMGKLL
jgi:hypothetical protein